MATADELRQAGVSSRAVQRSCAAGEIFRIRRGVYASASTHPAILRALRVGGALTCVSGAAFHGLWKPERVGTHVGVLNRASRLVHPDTGAAIGAGSRPGIVIHWSGRLSIVECRGIFPLVDCLLEVVRCQPEDIAFAVLESALHTRRLSTLQWRWLTERVSMRERALLSVADAEAGSGSESLFKFRMMRLGILMRSQVEIPGVGRVDFVIGDCLLVEIDSNAHHGGAIQRLRDLDRDAIAAGLGFVTLRFDYDQVMNDWATVEAAVLAVVARGGHLSSRRA